MLPALPSMATREQEQEQERPSLLLETARAASVDEPQSSQLLGLVPKIERSAASMATGDDMAGDGSGEGEPRGPEEQAPGSVVRSSPPWANLLSDVSSEFQFIQRKPRSRLPRAIAVKPHPWGSKIPVVRPAPAKKKKKTKKKTRPGLCKLCHRTKTPMWRTLPTDRSVQLCNACGIRARAPGAVLPKHFHLLPPPASTVVVSEAEQDQPPPPQEMEMEIQQGSASESPPDSPIWHSMQDLDVYLLRRTSPRRRERENSPPPPPAAAPTAEAESSSAAAAALPDDRGKAVKWCLHCGATSTLQWRMGPMGPGTLCNPCGVRFRQGRLVPEYRPMASPTFNQAEHSNKHRQVLRIRELQDQPAPPAAYQPCRTRRPRNRDGKEPQQQQARKKKRSDGGGGGGQSSSSSAQAQPSSAAAMAALQVRKKGKVRKSKMQPHTPPPPALLLLPPPAPLPGTTGDDMAQPQQQHLGDLAPPPLAQPHACYDIVPYQPLPPALLHLHAGDEIKMEQHLLLPSPLSVPPGFEEHHPVAQPKPPAKKKKLPKKAKKRPAGKLPEQVHLPSSSARASTVTAGDEVKMEQHLLLLPPAPPPPHGDEMVSPQYLSPTPAPEPLHAANNDLIKMEKNLLAFPSVPPGFEHHPLAKKRLARLPEPAHVHSPSTATTTVAGGDDMKMVVQHLPPVPRPPVPPGFENHPLAAKKKLTTKKGKKRPARLPELQVHVNLPPPATATTTTTIVSDEQDQQAPAPHENDEIQDSDSPPDSPILESILGLNIYLLKRTTPRRKETTAPPASSSTAESAEAPKWCLNCGTTSSLQWRTGPAGPSTLCVACGVKYRQGRLVPEPEYQPRASPTFDQHQSEQEHSNKHHDDEVLQLHELLYHPPPPPAPFQPASRNQKRGKGKQQHQPTPQPASVCIKSKGKEPVTPVLPLQARNDQSEHSKKCRKGKEQHQPQPTQPASVRRNNKGKELVTPPVLLPQDMVRPQLLTLPPPPPSQPAGDHMVRSGSNSKGKELVTTPVLLPQAGDDMVPQQLLPLPPPPPSQPAGDDHIVPHLPQPPTTLLHAGDHHMKLEQPLLLLPPARPRTADERMSEQPIPPLDPFLFDGPAAPRIVDDDEPPVIVIDGE